MRLIGGLFQIALPACIAVVLLSLFATHLGTEYPFNLLLQKIIALALFAGAYILMVRKSNYWWSILSFSTAMFMSTVWLLYGVTSTLGGVSGDNYFSTSMVATFLNNSANVDFNYRELHSFYPFYFHYAIAKIGSIFNLSSVSTFKYGALVAVYLTPLLTYYLWKKIYSGALPVLLTCATVFSVSVAAFLRKPHEIITLATIIPWWLYYFNLSDKTYKNAIIGGSIGGALFGIYYYWFFPIAISSVIALTLNRRTIFFEKRYLYYIAFLLSGLITSSFYLLPYLSDLIFVGSESLQNRWLLSEHFNFPLQKIDSIHDVILLASLIYLMASKGQIQRLLLLLLCSSYLWILLGYVGISLDFPLLHEKTNVLIYTILWFGVVLFIEEQLTDKTASLNGKNLVYYGLFLFFTGAFLAESAAQYETDFWKKAKNFSIDSLTVDPDRKVNLLGKTLLSQPDLQFRLSSLSEVYFFVSRNPHFSHPSALYTTRVEFLRLLNESQDPAFIAWMLRNNRFSNIDYVYLPSKSLALKVDNFPNEEPFFIKRIKFDEPFFEALIPQGGGYYKVPETPSTLDYEALSQTEKLIYELFSRHAKIDLQGNEDSSGALAAWNEYLDGGSRIIESGFSVYIDSNKKLLTYLKSPCSTSEEKAQFFLRLTPIDRDKLPADRKKAGFEKLDFHLDEHGYRYADICIAQITLPGYDLASIRTGEFDRQNNLWQGSYEFSPKAQE